jgi:hypothetical protein
MTGISVPDETSHRLKFRTCAYPATFDHTTWLKAPRSEVSRQALLDEITAANPGMRLDVDDARAFAIEI